MSAKGYGVGTPEDGAVVEPQSLNPEEYGRLRGWLTQMTLDNTLAIVGPLLVMLAFLILGTELLQPRGLVLEEHTIAQTLGDMLGALWGPFGFWLMIVGVFVGFLGTLISGEDGFGRLFANGTAIVTRARGGRGHWADETFLKGAYGIVLLMLLPIGLYWVAGNSVRLLKIAGAIEAAHIPFVTVLTLWSNRRLLPESLRPSWPIFVLTALAALFFAAFAVMYLLTLAGLLG
jgi:hypothetical protein